MLDPIELYNRSARADLEEFGSRFTSFRKTAYRLELLPIYTVAEEDAAFQQYLNGGKQPPAGFNADWLGILDTAQASGKRFSRTRVVVHTTPYIKFEIAWGYANNVKHGEQIRILLLDQLVDISQKVPILNDFWLFDDSDCYLIEYDVAGRFLGALKLPADAVPPYVELMRGLSTQGFDVATAMKRLGLGG